MKKILIHLLKPLSFLPAILMMYLIYSFSAQTGEVSGALSYEVSYQIVETKNEVLNENKTYDELAYSASSIEFYVRKAAHMTEYCLLAIAISFPLMITVGIGTNLTDYAKVFTNPAYIVIIMATVIGAMIGTFIVGKLFHFYPVEGMLTAGLCMANGGGAGDVQCLGAAHRMELMSYAQISSRIGGAIMLVIASFIFGKFL